MNVLSLSHTDLDGISCQFVLDRTFKNVTNMNISYGKIEEYISIVNDYCGRMQPDKVFITDLSFTMELFEMLSDMTKNHPDIHFYFIDHHPFEGEFRNYARENFTIVITDKASATKLTYLFCKANFNLNDKELETYTEYVNAYDIWLEDSPLFKVGLVYNELFWQYKINHFRSRFVDELPLRNSDKNNYKEMMVKKRKLFAKLEKSNRMFKLGDNDIFMIFIDDYRTHITLDYPDFKAYLIIASYGGISVRLRDNGFFKDAEGFKNKIVDEMLKNEHVVSAGGHPNAFGITVGSKEPSILVEVAKEALKIIDLELDIIKGK